MKRVVVFFSCGKMSFDPDFMDSYIRARTYFQQQMEGYELVEYYSKRFPPSESRNECVGRMKEGFRGFKPDISIWLDIDHILPYDVLVKLLEHDLPIVSGIYYLKDYPHYPIVYRKTTYCEDTGFSLALPVLDYGEELFEVDYAGMGCVRIDRGVFEELKPPYFEYREHSKYEEEDVEFLIRHGIKDNSEEFAFWDQVKEKIMVDPSIKIGHFGRKIVGEEEFNYCKTTGAFKGW